MVDFFLDRAVRASPARFDRQCLLIGPEQDIFFLMRYGFDGTSCNRHRVNRHPVLSILKACVTQSRSRFFKSVEGERSLGPGRLQENAPAHGRNRFEVPTKAAIFYEAELEAIDNRSSGVKPCRQSRDVKFGAGRAPRRRFRSRPEVEPPDLLPELAAPLSYVERFYEWCGWILER
jgi:hypothetical protein